MRMTNTLIFWNDRQWDWGWWSEGTKWSIEKTYIHEKIMAWWWDNLTQWKGAFVHWKSLKHKQIMKLEMKEWRCWVKHWKWTLNCLNLICGVRKKQDDSMETRNRDKPHNSTDCSFGVEGAKTLSDALKQNPKIHKVLIWSEDDSISLNSWKKQAYHENEWTGNKIGDEGAMAFCDFVKSHPSLDYINAASLKIWKGEKNRRTKKRLTKCPMNRLWIRRR